MRNFLFSVIFVIAGCSDETASNLRAKAATKANNQAGASVEVSRDQFKDEWPLTVEMGRVSCLGGDAYLFTEPGGKVYGLNGVALQNGYPRIDPIWRDNPKLNGAKMSLSPLFEVAEKQCKR